jgi:hypothetical protein
MVEMVGIKLTSTTLTNKRFIISNLKSYTQMKLVHNYLDNN